VTHPLFGLVLFCDIETSQSTGTGRPTTIVVPLKSTIADPTTNKLLAHPSQALVVERAGMPFTYALVGLNRNQIRINPLKFLGTQIDVSS